MARVCCGLRMPAQTRKPDSASRRAISSPSPREAPVTRTPRPLLLVIAYLRAAGYRVRQCVRLTRFAEEPKHVVSEQLRLLERSKMLPARKEHRFAIGEGFV